MTIAVEIKPELNRLHEWQSFLSRAGCADITDVGDMDASFEMAYALKDIGVKPIVNVACNKRSEAEIRSCLERAQKEGVQDVLILAGNEWNRTVRPTDVMKAASNCGLYVGAVLNTNMPDREAEIKLARRKVSYGANFFVTQPIWSYEDVQEFYSALKMNGIDVEIYWGLFAANDFGRVSEISMDGIHVPDYVVAKSMNSSSGTKISRTLLDDFRSCGENVYLMGRRYTTIERII